MAWTEIKRLCGHVEDVQIYGSGKERERKVYAMERHLCAECQKIEDVRLEKERASDLDLVLPDLAGSEKQIAWATKIRSEKLFWLKDDIKSGASELPPEKMKKTMQHILNKRVYASWWIDNKEKAISRIAKEEVEFAQEQAQRETRLNKKAEEDKDRTAKPEGEAGVVVSITKGENKLLFLSVKDDSVIAALKSKGCKWNAAETAWEKDITWAGDPADREAEIGNALLAAGNTVVFTNKDIKEAALKGNIKPEPTRWIINGDGSLLKAFWTTRSDDEAYALTKGIKGAKWSNGVVLIDVSRWKEIQDLTDDAGFVITDKAAQKIAEYKKLEEEKLLEVKKSKKKSISDVLSSSAEILSDLRDDE